MSPRSMRWSTCGIAMLLKPLPLRDPKKTKSVALLGRQRAQQLDGALRQWHPVLAAALHAPSRYQPRLVFERNLGPLRADDLASASDGEDRKFQRASGHAFALSQLRHEGRHVAVGHARHDARPSPPAAARWQHFGRVVPKRQDCRPRDSHAPVAQSITVRIRPRTREAVSVCACQNGQPDSAQHRRSKTRKCRCSATERAPSADRRRS